MADLVGMHESKLFDFTQIDMVDDQRGKFTTQNVCALFANGENLDRLAFSEELTSMITRKTRNLAVETAAKATFCSRDDEQMHVVLARTSHQCRCVFAAHVLRDISEDGTHALRVRPCSLRSFLGTAQLRCGDHLHRLGDFLRRLDRGDTVSQIL